MTLIIGLAGQPFTVVASVPLVTLADARDGRYLGEHDRRANKLVVAVLRDAVVCIGYSGSAYVRGRPTDDWIVDTSAPGSGIFSGGRPLLSAGALPRSSCTKPATG